MTPRLVFLLLLAGCAGPAAHRTAEPGSARALTQAEAARPAVASTLSPADPLAAPHCGLPLAAPCPPPEEGPSKQEEDPHHHHQPQQPPEPAQPLEDPHQHHQAAPASAPAAAPATKVIDPVCKMKLDPKAAKGGSLELDGKRHWFCSSSCRTTFKSQHPGAK